jgi:hypothetical protein
MRAICVFPPRANGTTAALSWRCAAHARCARALSAPTPSSFSSPSRAWLQPGAAACPPVAMGSSRKAKNRRKTTHTKVKACVPPPPQRCSTCGLAPADAAPRALVGRPAQEARPHARVRGAAGHGGEVSRRLRCRRRQCGQWPDAPTPLACAQHALGEGDDAEQKLQGAGPVQRPQRGVWPHQPGEACARGRRCAAGVPLSLPARALQPQWLHAVLTSAARGRQATLGAQASTDEESMRVAIGQHLPKGQRPPKRLTAMQLVRRAAAGIRRAAWACAELGACVLACRRASWARWCRRTATTCRPWCAT